MKNTSKVNTTEKQSWKPFLHILKRDVPWVWMIANLIVSLSTSSLYVYITQLSGQIMAGEIFDSAIIWQYIGWTVLSTAVSLIVGVSTSWSMYFTERKEQLSLWQKMIRLPMRDYNKQNPSSLISRLTTDTTLLTNSLSYITSIIVHTYTLVLMLVDIHGMAPSIAYSILLVVPYILLVAAVPGRILYRVQAKLQDALAQFTNYITERLLNIRLVKSAATERTEIQLGYAAAEANFKADMKLSLVDLCIQPFMYSTESVVGAIILVSGSIMVSQGKLDMESLITMYLYSSEIFIYLLQYIITFQEMKKAQGALKVVGEIMESDTEELKREISFTQPDEDLVFENVSFSYDNQNVLSDVSLTIPCGKTTAIVGPSGAGKTTILSLVERLYTPNAGVIYFGDTPVEKFHLDEWRESFGYIQQNSPILSGTIRENITYGLDREATEAEVVRAAKMANAYDFIMKLPEGFDTDIGQLGGKLSGGERQRIAIARMIIKDPTYLLLDEATSNLDAENEVEVQDALNKLLDGRTAIVIAHKLRTVVNADNIIVMDQGRVQATGTHKDLYKANALYKKYYDLQFAGQE